MHFERHWQYIRRWFSATALQLLVGWFALVPIVVKLLDRMPSTLTIETGQTPIVLHLALPFRWWLLWLASFFYTVSWILYVVRAPSIIKRYPNFTAYKQEGHSPRWIVWEVYYVVSRLTPTTHGCAIRNMFIRLIESPDRLLNQLVDKKLARPVLCGPECTTTAKPIKLETKTAWTFRLSGAVYELAIGERDTDVDEREREIFWELYGFLAGSRAVARSIILILCVSGAALFLIAVAQNVWVVLAWIVDHAQSLLTIELP